MESRVKNWPINHTSVPIQLSLLSVLKWWFSYITFCNQPSFYKDDFSRFLWKWPPENHCREMWSTLAVQPEWHVIQRLMELVSQGGYVRIQKILSEEVQLWQYFFFSWWGVWGSKYHYKWAIISPPAKRHLNGISLASWCWPNIKCWLGSFVIFQGIWTRIVRKP